MANITKRRQKINVLIDQNKVYSPVEAITTIKQCCMSKFDETIDVAFYLGINPKHADQQVRTTVSLPAGTGKKVRIAVVAKGERVKEALDSGADVAGSEDLLEKIKEGWFEFDVLISTQDMMAVVSKLGKLLGPKGLMPNPKAGTVIPPEAIPRAIKEFKAGKIEFRNDKQGNVHIPIGKASFEDKMLLTNFSAVVEAIIKAKPVTAKGIYIKNLALSCTMGPGLKIDPNKLNELAASASE
jgi:large subunit ribosomal protein L1